MRKTILLTFAKAITFLRKSVLPTPQRVTKDMPMPLLMRWSVVEEGIAEAEHQHKH